MANPTDPETLQKVRQEIRDLAASIAELSKQDLEVEEYFEQFLQGVVTAMAAAGGAVWTKSSADDLKLVFQINLRTTEIDEGGEDQARHRRLLQRVMAGGEPLLLAPYSGNEDAGNPTRFLLILVPLKSDDAIEGVVEIFQRPATSIEVQRGYLTFLERMCDLAGDWIKRRQYRQLSGEQLLWRRLDAFAQNVHESLDTRATAFVLANEGRHIIECDRVSVAVRQSGKFNIEAVSGQDTLDRRSNMVVMLQGLVRKVLAAGEPLWYTGETLDLPPQIESGLHDYVDAAHTKTLGIVPLRRPSSTETRVADDENHRDDDEDSGEIIGALVVEQIEDRNPFAALRTRTQLIAPHAARALVNAYDHGNLFLMPLWRALGHSRVLVQARHLPKTLTVGSVLLVAILLCLLIRINFNLEGPAELQPTMRQDVFASVDGVVKEVHVKTGDPVKKGDPLVTLRDTDLMVHLETVQGQLQVATKRQLALERRLLDNSVIAPSERSTLSTELAQLRRQRASLEIQRNLLLEKQAMLTVASPIDGHVITWDVRRTLNDRKVAPGQVLMTVADRRSEWELIVYMPGDNMGYVTAAENTTPDGQQLDVTYIVATDPGRKLHGKVREINPMVEPHETHGHSVKILVDIDEADLHHPRPGATATAEVHCGRRSIAFVWLHDVLEFVQSRVLF